MFEVLLQILRKILSEVFANVEIVIPISMAHETVINSIIFLLRRQVQANVLDI